MQTDASDDGKKEHRGQREHDAALLVFRMRGMDSMPNQAVSEPNYGREKQWKAPLEAQTLKTAVKRLAKKDERHDKRKQRNANQNKPFIVEAETFLVAHF